MSTELAIAEALAAQSITAADVLNMIERAATGILAYVEQTGGGTATIFVGDERDYHSDARFLLAFGPGSYHWTEPGLSTFDFGDVYLGPDDQGESDDWTTITDAAQLAIELARQLALPDWGGGDATTAAR